MTSESQSLLDIGTGSGILAISAAKLGYGPVHGFDFDPEAVRVAKANARANGVARAVTEFAGQNRVAARWCAARRGSGLPGYRHPPCWSRTRPSPSSPSNPHVPYVASIFDVVHDAGLSTGLYASKSKFVLFERSWDATHGAPDVVPPDFGRNKIDHYVNKNLGSPANAGPMQSALMSDLRAAPIAFCFVHYLELDAIGHATGWGSPAWRDGVRMVDGYLGDLLALVDGDARYRGRTVLVLTADHGGSGKDHGDAMLAADYTIPFLVYGAGVAHGADLLGVAGERAAVGEDRAAADLAVVGDVAVRHEETAVPDPGHSTAAAGADVRRRELAELIPAPDHEPGLLALVLEVLRDLTQACVWEDPVRVAERGVALDDRVRADHVARPHLHGGADDRVRPDLAGRIDLRAGSDDGGGVNRHLRRPPASP